MISVVIPARNAAATVAASLASLAADRAVIGEILLVDDGSDDDTAARAVEAASRHELPLSVVSARAGSAAGARNAGIERARGDHIFFFDADDTVIAGSLTRLHDALRANPRAGLAVGPAFHHDSRTHRLKQPGRYTPDLADNARRYLFNELRSITVGSALVSAEAARGIRFPETMVLDEDTLYWAAVLTRAAVVTIDKPVLVYNLDAERMAQRFVENPRKVLLAASVACNGLRAFGIDRRTLQARKAFIAQRIVRHLVRRNRFAEAADMWRAARCMPGARAALKALDYRLRIAVGRFAQSWGRSMPRGLTPEPRPMAARRTMVLSVDPAFPPVSGADLRNSQNARAAAGLGEVLLVSVHPPDGDHHAGERIDAVALTARGEPRGKPLVRWRTGIEPRIPRIALDRLLKRVHRFRPDTILVEGIALHALLPHLRPMTPRLVLDMHNVESALASGTPASWLAGIRPAAWSEHERIRHREIDALKQVDRVWVCSELDRDRLAPFGPAVPVDMVPNGIPRVEEVPEILPPVAGREGGWPVILFVGHLSYQPNVVAAERLARAILPMVRQTFTAAKLVLAGRSPAPPVRRLAGLPGVELVENPAEIAPLLTGSHVTVVPLAQGGGTRIKIAEAMAWGLPVVATALAAEGQGLVAGEDILIAETDAALAAAAVALLSDPQRLERQRRLARDKTVRLYGGQAIRNAVAKGLAVSAPDAD